MMTRHLLLRNLSSRKQHTFRTYKVLQWWVWDCASYSCCTLLSAPTRFCKASSLIRGSTNFSGLFLNDFPSMYKVIVATILQEVRVDISVPFYTVKNLCKHRQAHMISRVHLYPTFEYIGPTESWVKTSHWYFNWLAWRVFIQQILCSVFIAMLMKGYKIVTCLLKYIYLPYYVQNNPLKRHAFTPSIHPL